MIVASGVIADIENRCSVAGTPECNIRGLMVLAQTLDAVTPAQGFCGTASSLYIYLPVRAWFASAARASTQN